jgi:hypothetical protein
MMTELKGNALAEALFERINYTTFDVDRKWFRLAAREIQRLSKELEESNKPADGPFLEE